MKIVTWLCSLMLLCTTLHAGNLKISDDVRIVGVNDDHFTLSLSLSWDNSWQDGYNFDAVWLFVKYRTQEEPVWNPLFFSPTGHQIAPQGGYLPGETGSEVVGLFVWQDSPVNGKADLQCRINCKIPNGITARQVENNELYFAVQGIEMVYIPAGAYYLGDGAASGSFCVTGSQEPHLIVSEDAVSFSDETGAVLDLSAKYPKGYNGFFCMKTEITQGQYVDFLNLLSLDEQIVLTNTYDMPEGRFVFDGEVELGGVGSPEPKLRNGIKLQKGLNEDESPLIFINDLNNNGIAREDGDGQALACNFLSAMDMFSYASWAGLRPLSELEYEKACRRLFPEYPRPLAYPWGTESGAVAIVDADVKNIGTLNERIDGVGNVNANNRRNNPVRGGAFAVSGSTAQTAGASFWGIMEMAGNLKECCIAATVDFTSECGNGNIQPFWSGAVWRGGGFRSDLTKLQISNRDKLDMDSEDGHEQDGGGRFCRSISAGFAGQIGAVKQVVCMNEKGEVREISSADARTTSYRWVVREGNSNRWTVIPQATQKDLEYEPAVRRPGVFSYYVRRIACSRWGELLSNEVELIFHNNGLHLSSLKDTVNACDESRVISASHHQAGTIRWRVNQYIRQEDHDVDAAEYTPDRSLGDAGTEVTVICESEIEGCTQSQEIAVYIAPKETDSNSKCWSCGDLVVDADGNTYATIPREDGNCWMQANLRINVPDSYQASGVDEEKYGRLYTWSAATKGESGEKVQGICPNGWHIPTKAEWDDLERAANDRGEGSSLVDKLRLSLSGYYAPSTGVYSRRDESGDYWSSTLKTGGTAIGITIDKGSDQVRPYEGDTDFAISVRCVRNETSVTN